MEHFWRTMELRHISRNKIHATIFKSLTWKVCERRQPKDCPTTINGRKLCTLDPPSVFYCIKSSLLPTSPSAPRKTVRAHGEIRNIIPDELYSFEENDRIEDIDNIWQYLMLTILILIMYEYNNNWFFSLENFW